MRDYYDNEPTAADLAAIEAEEPLLAAEFDWALAECEALAAFGRGRFGELDARRVRRAEQAVIRETLVYAARRHRSTGPRRAA